MKKKYVFFGQLSEIEGIAKLTTFGQVVSLDETMAVDLSVNGSGCSIIPEDMFNSIGFSPKDIEGRQPRRTDDFVVKMSQLIDSHRAWVESLVAKKEGIAEPAQIPEPVTKK